MTLPLRLPPVAEPWDCHHCGDCCRRINVPLREEDLRRLRQQRWDEHPDYRGVPVVVRHGVWRKRHRLAKRSDGSCVFLTSDNRCVIHREHGAAAKPLICRMFPFQLVPLEGFAYVTLRRFCPSAAAGKGRTLDVHRDTIRELAEESQAAKPTRPPAVTRRDRCSWRHTLWVVEAIERLMLDAGYPLVRRLVHGLQLCTLLDQSRLHKLEGNRLGELLRMLEAAAPEGAGELFRDRTAPGKRAAALFRQIAMEHVRLHPEFVVGRSWPERWRLVRAAMTFARGKGPVPRIHPSFPETTFEALQRPLGHLDEPVLRPINAYFETAAASARYAAARKSGWSIVESFRALAISYAAAMWLMRLSCGDRPPEVADAVHVVGTIDRGLTYAPLIGRRHRMRVAALDERGELGRLAAWYAR